MLKNLIKYILLLFIFLGFENLNSMKTTGEQINKKKGLDPLPLNKDEFEKVYKKIEEFEKKLTQEIDSINEILGKIEKKYASNENMIKLGEIFNKKLEDFKKQNDNYLSLKTKGDTFILTEFNSLSDTVSEKFKKFEDNLKDIKKFIENFETEKNIKVDISENQEKFDDKFLKRSIYILSGALAIIAGCEIYVWLKTKKLFNEIKNKINKKDVNQVV